jgi:membrane-associated phospholipid phosphatase
MSKVTAQIEMVRTGRQIRGFLALCLLAVLFAASLIFFTARPYLDILISRAFLDSQNTFRLVENPFWDRIVQINRALSIIIVVLAAALLFASLTGRWNARRLMTHYGTFVLLLYAIGPGLMVNGVLKRVYGRARPFQTTDFGGDGPFAAAWQFSGFCRAACSFISAEVSAATALAVALSIGAVWFGGSPFARILIAFAAAAYVLLILTAMQRMGSGQHFLSDVVFSFLLTAGLGVVLSRTLSPARQRVAVYGEAGLTR